MEEQNQGVNNNSNKFRQSLFFIICGTNGTGKTTLLNKLIGNLEKKVLVCDPDGMEWNHYSVINIDDVGKFKKGKARILAPNSEDLDYLIDFQNGCLILDDCRYYVKSSIEESIRRVLIRRRQNSVDVFAVAHGLSEIPPTFWTFSTHLILFKTNDSMVRVRNAMDGDRLKKMKIKQNEINSNPSHYYYEIINISDL